MLKIVLLRHGQSEWNEKHLFTGWTDVGLTKRGEEEAREAGRKMLEEGFSFDLAFTSRLKRASLTLDLALNEMKQTDIETIVDWRLNERHYGDLQGKSKKKMAEIVGEQQVKLWRRSYAVRPPEIGIDNEFNQINDPKYSDIEVPKCESLADVVVRVKAFWQEEIIPRLKQGKKILISASGNSLRALVMYLDDMNQEDIVELNIPTGVPLVYELGDDLKPMKHYYLEGEDELEKRVDEVASQGKKE